MNTNLTLSDIGDEKMGNRKGGVVIRVLKLTNVSGYSVEECEVSFERLQKRLSLFGSLGVNKTITEPEVTGYGQTLNHSRYSITSLILVNTIWNRGAINDSLNDYFQSTYLHLVAKLIRGWEISIHCCWDCDNTLHFLVKSVALFFLVKRKISWHNLITKKCPYTIPPRWCLTDVLSVAFVSLLGPLIRESEYYLLVTDFIYGKCKFTFLLGKTWPEEKVREKVFANLRILGYLMGANDLTIKALGVFQLVFSFMRIVNKDKLSFLWSWDSHCRKFVLIGLYAKEIVINIIHSVILFLILFIQN